MDIAIARIIQVLAVVIWIGGVGMVTTVILPSIRRMNREDKPAEAFHRVESRFSRQARVTSFLAGLSGFYMMYRLDAWERYLDYRFWWIHAMTLTWLVFTLILFVFEPFVFDKLLKNYLNNHPEKAFKFLYRAHWVLLGLSILTISGAMAAGHGLYLF